MFPGNDGERSGRDRTEKLRDHDDMFAAVFVRQMSRGQRQTNHRNREHPTDEGEKISRHIKIEVGKAKGGVGVVRRRTNWRNSLRRLVVIHESARSEMRSREASVAICCRKGGIK